MVMVAGTRTGWRRFTQPPLREKSISFQFFNTGKFTAANLKVQLGPWEREESAWAWAKITADEIVLRGLKARGVSVELEKVLFVPSSEESGQASWDDVRFLSLGRLKVGSLAVTGADLAVFLEERIKGLDVRELQIADGALLLKAGFKNLSLAARLEPVVDKAERRLRLELQEPRMGVTPLPGWLLGPLTGLGVPLEPNPETPFWIDLPGLTLKGGKLSVP